MIDRRAIITAALAAIASPASTRTALAQAAMSRITAYAFSFPALAGGDIRLADYAGRPLLVVHPTICRTAGVMDPVSRSRLDDHRRSLERFRRARTGRRHRDRGDRAASIWGYLSDGRESHRKGHECASILQMGRRRAPEGCSALELSQVSDRPRRLHR